MKFSINSPILFVIVAIIISAVIGQSVYFLVRAVKRAKELGMPKEIIRKTISSSAVFTIAPAVSVLVGVLTLSKSIGIALPWLRLSVIGSITYETVAVKNALSPLNIGTETAITNASDFVTVAWVMTLGIIIGLVLVPFLTKRIQGGMNKMGMKDKKWGEIFNNAMFLGMISAFLGYVFCDVGGIIKGDTSGFIPVVVMAVSAIVMALCGGMALKFKIKWLTDYALPISLVSGMAVAIPVTSLLG